LPTQAGGTIDNAGLVPKPTMPFPSLQQHRPPQARNDALYIFLCHFGPTNPDFDMLHCFCSGALL
jgi:hypothetical protein